MDTNRPVRATDGPATGSRPLTGDATARFVALDGAQFDVVVIGAGILGAGVARELARRGRRTLVVERRDAGWGTINRSTRLVHGGLRSLEHFDFPLVYEGLRERGWLLRATPRLVTPLGLLLPYYRESWFHRTQLRMGLTLYDLLAPRGSLPRHRSVSGPAPWRWSRRCRRTAGTRPGSTGTARWSSRSG